MKIGVTGATGFIGGAIAQRLTAGHAVRALARRPPPAGSSPAPVEWVGGDLTDPKSLASFAGGLDAVVHCAARTSEGAPNPAESQAVNVEGTGHLLRACQQA
ncbi:MAG TPA: NAD-dependent epimerase/dehydratase family protein, partial [Elusimicrobiota bacterium]|nr:NAD-dependent epimerase/dehydratase family protein [Elusimicrobiota bacterium]